MARVTSSEVEEVLNTTFDSSFNADAFINSANLMVDNTVKCSSATETVKAEIEKYIAAHFISMITSNGGVKREKLGDAEIEYAFTGGSGLKSTPYGQLAIMLDPCGSLATIGSPAAFIKAIYTNPTTYGYKDYVTSEDLT